jgi:hypothetical protein
MALARPLLVATAVMAVVVVIVAIATVLLPGGTTGAPAACDSHVLATGTPATSNLSYQYEVVTLPYRGGSGGPLTDLTFGGVRFLLWPEPEGSNSTQLVGRTDEPDGVDLTFVLLPNDGDTGGAPNSTAPGWFAPDGAAGIVWIYSTNASLQLELSVATPPVTEAAENVTLPPSSGDVNSSSSCRSDFEGYDLTFSRPGGGLPDGPRLNVSGSGPSGSLGVELGGFLLSCNPPLGTPVTLEANATCYAVGTDDHGLTILWDGGADVTLLVRIV